MIKGTDFQEGMDVGRWWVPTGGFEWRSDLAVMVPEEEGPWLVARGQEVEVYPILRRRSVLKGFARLAREPSQEALTAFAEKWGPLGIGRPLANEAGTQVWGESLQTWQDEARFFSALYEVWDLIQQRRHSLLGEFVRWGDDPRQVRFWLAIGVDGALSGDDVPPAVAPLLADNYMPSDGPWLYSGGLLAGAENDPHNLLRRWPAGSVVGPARYFVQREVSRRLDGRVSPAILAFWEPATIRNVPNSLLGAIYLLFAKEIVGEGAVAERRCENPKCPNGGIFTSSRENKRYCDTRCRQQNHEIKRALARRGD